MTEEQIKPIVESYINQAIQDLDKENPKMDFKSEWYNLKEELGINEFLKDTSAIANTPGLDGYIIIGFKDKKKEFFPATFTDCGLKDSHELVGLINSRVDRAYDIAVFNLLLGENKISVIYIPPSFDKPHVIRKYEGKNGKIENQRVFIKNGSTTRIATKYDFDFISYDRKNQIAEYSLHLSSSKDSYYPNWDDGQKKFKLGLNLIIENNGLRPVAIYEIVLKLHYLDFEIEFISLYNKELQTSQSVKISNFVVSPGAINSYPLLVFQSVEKQSFHTYEIFLKKYKEFSKLSCTIKLNTGIEFYKEIKII